MAVLLTSIAPLLGGGVVHAQTGGGEDIDPLRGAGGVTGVAPSADTGVGEEIVVDEGAIPVQLVEIAREVRDLSLGERMSAISEPLLGLPYLVDAIGEGVPPDDDPPARYDAFDCLTFVEEILALSLAADPRSAPMVRNGLRYGGQQGPAYERRNHFMLQEWIPRNIESGWLEDITAWVGETHLLVKDVGPKTWSWWRRRKLFALTDDQLPKGTFSLQVLSPGAAIEAVDRIPDGALILTVRKSRTYVPIVVTHLGFKIPVAGDVALMRHSTKMGEVPRVRNDRLEWYIEHLRWYDRWPVEGITVLMPREPGPRVARLATPPLPGPRPCDTKGGAQALHCAPEAER